MALFKMMKLRLPVPMDTTVSRRSKPLKPSFNRLRSGRKPLHLIVDSTGLSFHGEGPWATGKKRRRGWRKRHIMVDREGLIHSGCVSKWYTRDGSRVPHLLRVIEGEIGSLTGDRGYDQNEVYKAVSKRNRKATMVIHPRSNAVMSGNKEWTQRDRHVHKIRCDGVYDWRRASGYDQQSRVENTFYRLKTILGKRLRARSEEKREVETKIGCKILNLFF